MLSSFTPLPLITAPVMAMLLFSFAGEADAAKAVIWKPGPAKTVVVKKPAHVVTVKRITPTRVRVVHVPRTRTYAGVRITRTYGRPYLGFGYYTTDTDAFAFLGLTALTLAILDNASEDQQRAHEQAFVRATTLPAGETIEWNDDGASGNVTVVRTGTRPNGQPCREFRQVVTIGGQSETAYGIACRQQDGAWRIVS